MLVETSEVRYAENFDKATPGWNELARIGCLCSTAEFVTTDSDQPPVLRKIRGDASEKGILRCYETIMADSTKVRSTNPKVAEIPFNSTNKYQLSIHDVDRKGRYQLVMKGAPETIIDRCKTILLDGKDKIMTDEMRKMVNVVNLELGDQGERVLGFCDLYLDSDEYPSGYQFDADEPNFPLSNFR